MIVDCGFALPRQGLGCLSIRNPQSTIRNRGYNRRRMQGDDDKFKPVDDQHTLLEVGSESKHLTAPASSGIVRPPSAGAAPASGSVDIHFGPVRLTRETPYDARKHRLQTLFAALVLFPAASWGLPWERGHPGRSRAGRPRSRSSPPTRPTTTTSATPTSPTSSTCGCVVHSAT